MSGLPDAPLTYMTKQKEIVVAIDGTGGDRGFLPVVNAVRFALALYPSLKLIIFGPSDLSSALAKAGVDAKRYEFRLASQNIPQDEDPKEVLAGYRKSAMRLAVEAVKNGEAHAVVSGGGTGPFVVLCRHILGTIGRVRPALCARMPSGPNHFTLMLDLGANASSSAEDLYDFAILGNAAAKLYQGISDPRIAVLNVGTEAGKGNRLIQEAKELIRADHNLLFEGFVEANRIFCGDCDVIVTDGFTGNVALKSTEGTAKLIGSMIKDAVKSSFLAMLGLPFMYFAMRKISKTMNPKLYNGAMFVGLNGLSVKSHGGTDAFGFSVAIHNAATLVRQNFVATIKEELEHIDLDEISQDIFYEVY